MLGDIEDFRQARIFVTAERRVEHVFGEDARFLIVITDARQRLQR